MLLQNVPNNLLLSYRCQNFESGGNQGIAQRRDAVRGGAVRFADGEALVQMMFDHPGAPRPRRPDRRRSRWRARGQSHSIARRRRRTTFHGFGPVRNYLLTSRFYWSFWGGKLYSVFRSNGNSSSHLPNGTILIPDFS